MKDTDVVWAAGFFDGEGHVRISRPCPRKARYSLAIIIGQVDPRPLSYLRALFGGAITSNGPRQRSTHAPAFRWILSGPSAGSFLRAVQPYLRVKDREAAVGIAFAESYGIAPRNVALPQYLTDLRHDLHGQLAVLNRKGADTDATS